MGHQQHDAAHAQLVDVPQVLRDVLVLMRGSIERVARVDLAAEPAPPVLADPRELGEVWLQLIANATEAVTASGRTDGRIAVDCRMEGTSTVKVAVHDNGTGMSADVAAKAFDAFFTTKAVGAGYGQGLAVARSTVARYGGTIEVASTTHEGTTMVVRLPIAAEPGEPPVQQRADVPSEPS